MHLLKLPWLAHSLENRRVECYSISVDPTGARLASGGLDGNVKIWDTASIRAFTGTPPPNALRRPLCSMSRHNGVVTSVKFSPDGRFLASGSDDKICLIWERDDDQVNRPKQFGDAEADLEHWTVRKRLVAHDNDIQDICWLNDGLLLVTVGLDRLIIVWNGQTFERIKRYDIHQSMVKGIVFDPANKFFATASDDRTVRIFRYHKKNDYLSYEFQVEHLVLDPFKKSPLTSYFRRMSWSPDGQHIAVPNATNGPVSSVVVVNRGNWSTDISLIGHEAPCEVCSFCPRLFEESTSSLDPSYSTVLATAGQDHTLAIWRTGNMRPILVAHEIASSSITDLCWLPEGDVLYVSSLDGLISCVVFELGELGIPVNETIVDSQLHRFGTDRESVVFPESVGQLLLEDIAKTMSKKSLSKPVPNKTLAAAALPATKAPDSRPLEPMQPAQAQTTSVAKKTPSTMTQAVTMKNGKRRVAPTLMSTSSVSSSSLVPKIAVKITRQQNSRVSQSLHAIPRLGIQTAVNGIKLRVAHEDTLNSSLAIANDNDNIDMGIDGTSHLPSNITISESALKRQRNKRRRLAAEARYPSCFKQITLLPEELFNNQAVVNDNINALINSMANTLRDSQLDVSNNTAINVDEDLIFSVIVRGIRHMAPSDIAEPTQKPISTLTTIEARNGKGWPEFEDDNFPDSPFDFDDATKVIVSNDLDEACRQYTLYFAYKIQHAHPILGPLGSLDYIVFVSFCGTVQIVAAGSGSYACPALELGVNVVKITLQGKHLCILTSAGTIFVWQVLPKHEPMRAILRNVSITPVLNLMPIDLNGERVGTAKALPAAIPQITFFEIDDLGMPIMILQGEAHVHRYDIDLQCWTRISDAWHFLAIKQSDALSTDRTWFCAAWKQHQEEVNRAHINTYDLSTTSTILLDAMRSRFDESMEMAKTQRCN